MHSISFEEAVENILQKDARYPSQAYYFVREGLNHTSRSLEKPQSGPGRHVTGRELLEGLKRFALAQFGPLTQTVLAHWGIQTTEDFGAIVFNLVEQGALGATEEDSMADFTDVYNFEAAFRDPYLPESRKTNTSLIS